METLSSIPLYIQSENIAVSTIMAVIGVFGLVSNGAAILAVRYNPALRNSFGLLCLSHSIANMGAVSVFVFWATPITFLGVVCKNICVSWDLNADFTISGGACRVVALPTTDNN
ncbi:hypothetical protein KIN20_027048 [Parelaphostrongylus tenuis]|uniref:7TM GPCR serpentine receptor class x (Srx) domain-containing protein n=1 Tax=Parelaphostrongylus tenuis TaxID=148309 RepID=A0AAD5WDQ0_PARTN|nr:hypothetical protein KIN20_027048 [Parelaphostrongylus tenuis]